MLKPTKVTELELSQPLKPLANLAGYTQAWILLHWYGIPVGSITVPITQGHCRSESIMTALEQQQPTARALIAKKAWPLPQPVLPDLDIQRTVSIVISTYDRPQALAQCLTRLTLCAQSSPRRSIQIIVVDNHPASGVTPPVVAKFAAQAVVLVSEPRSGSSYGRNAGIREATGEIIVTVDDDVQVSVGWLERLLAPLARPEVAVVTGNLLPIDLSTPAQQWFENYANGGLGRGFARFEVGPAWFARPGRAVPTWELGATANAAFRACIFQDPAIGLMEETLGAGMPSGGGEDLYLFYKVLKAGHTIVYEPTAYAWHHHRDTLVALRRQIYNYSKACIANHLTTLLRDGDMRSLMALFVGLPLYHGYLFKRWLGRETDYPLRLILLEIWGHWSGPWGLLQAWLKVRRLRSSFPPSPPRQLRRARSGRAKKTTLPPYDHGSI